MAEDEALVAIMISDLLEEAGYEVAGRGGKRYANAANGAGNAA